MNGINAPKVVECLGSDGKRYKQLAKSGNDDLRQDAVMEQLFDLVNSLLVRHRDTSSRSLGIRTYKVVPFTPSAGETSDGSPEPKLSLGTQHCRKASTSRQGSPAGQWARGRHKERTAQGTGRD